MNRVKNVSGFTSLSLYNTGAKKKTIYRVDLSYDSQRLENWKTWDGKSSQFWVPEAERLSLIDISKLDPKEQHIIKDKTVNVADNEQILAQNDCIPKFHILTKIFPKINDNGVFSSEVGNCWYEPIFFSCDNPNNEALIFNEIRSAIDSINFQFGTDYTFKIVEQEIKAAKVFPFENWPTDHNGNKIEIGDIVVRSSMGDSRVSFGQVVGMSKQKVSLDNGSKPFFENVEVVRKYNGTTAFIGY